MTTYLVTGGSGSFGRAFARATLDSDPDATIRALSRDEAKLAAMRLAFQDHPRLRAIVGDVRDVDRLTLAARTADVIIHAAAMKRVDECQREPDEAAKTNVLGTMNVLAAARACGVKKVLALSSDKASAPVNAYGATKLTLEYLVTAGQVYSGADGPRLAVLRYGNVAGSRGSVIPLWREFLARTRDAPVPVTHQAMTRFWFTLPSAVRFARWCLDAMAGGELFVPRLPSFRIVDLAQAMAPERPYAVVGVTRGEKLHELMVSEDEGPAFFTWRGIYARFPEGREPPDALPCPDGFRYRSDENYDMMDVPRLRRALEAV